MNGKNIDINCDVGEGIGNEPELFPFISSCNIACGGHAGDEDTIREIGLLANKHKVKVGAHPSYPDKDNFGRVALDITEKELKETLKHQVNTFLKVIVSAGVTMNHIKPHGALYNEIAKNNKVAITFLEAIHEFKKKAILYVPYKSVVAKIAKERGFAIRYEVFCDRNYNDDLTLVSRKEKDSLILDEKKVFEHVLRIVEDNAVKTISGSIKKIKADTFCIHGDTPNAIEILTYLSNELPKRRIQISK
ncbi:5-oxoprolinase subunit PxpA [uncultured Croceitalea sp.]|uniref:5-oxoprolinase subunit PxpA n=1 Tax=uncultured Croceitalea sp. TaxID=1798908 RepID=UPI003305F1B7